MCYCIVHLIIFPQTKKSVSITGLKYSCLLVLYPHVCLCVSADNQITSALYPLFSH